MKFRTPSFFSKKSFISSILLPFAWLYRIISTIHQFFQHRNFYTSKKKVLCIGNITVGGAGKTPTAIMIGKILNQENIKFCYLTRGYGMKIKQNLFLPKGSQAANYNGLYIDEPLLLSCIGDVFITTNRKKTLSELENSDYEWIVMDDGLQNQSIKKDAIILAIDGTYGLGNRRMLPAGPLRQFPIDVKPDLVSILGEDVQNLSKLFKCRKIYPNIVMATDDNLDKNNKYLAFAGLARNKKFFNYLESIGLNVADKVDFPDHYNYRDCDIQNIISKARKNKYQIITTEKDILKISKHFHSDILVLRIKYEVSTFDKQQILLLLQSIKKSC